MPWAKVLRSGQVTFPKEVRESLNLKEGDIVDFRIKGSEVTIRPKVMVDKEKADVWKMLDDIHNKMKGTDPEKIEKLIEEAIREVRKGKINAKAQKK
ncbi:MAG: AbrB/MazE/SpoVT family DNA-binding domain-containing protein [Pseudomonadota bacterium]|nr:AbrB/MazE/SpoVT family DNA-binding domain-containing protein [Pseudomonadota bacterium]